MIEFLMLAEIIAFDAPKRRRCRNSSFLKWRAFGVDSLYMIKTCIG